VGGGAGPTAGGSGERDYVLNKNTMKFHYPSCSSVKDIKEKNRWDYTGTREEIIDMGYVPCKKCNP
jgi:DNA-entry nuclease